MWKESSVDSNYGTVSTESLSSISSKEHGTHKKIGVLGLVVLAFFFIDGSMYGSEFMLQLGPPAYVFLVLILSVFLYMIPAAVISIDLSIAFPVDGGYVQWIDEAFQDYPWIGVQNMYWSWVNAILTAAIFPIMAGHYITKVVGNDLDPAIYAEMLILLLLALRMFSFSELSFLNILMAISSLIPMFLFVGFTIPHIQPATWTESTGIYNCSYNLSGGSNDDDYYIEGDGGLCKMPIDWSSLLCYAMWLWAGFFNLGVLAGEVEEPRRTFPRALVILVPAIFFQSAFPLALSLSIDTNLSHYQPGNFTTIAEKVTGKWLEYIILVGATITQFGLINGQGLVADESLQSFALKHVPRFFSVRSHSPSKMTRWFFNTDFRIAPVFAFFDVAILAILVWVDYDLIITASMLVFNLTVMLLLASHLILKKRYPEKTWLLGPKLLPSVLIALMPGIGTVAMTVLSSMDGEAVLGVPYMNLVSFVVILLIGGVLHLLFVVATRKIVKAQAPDETIKLIQPKH